MDRAKHVVITGGANGLGLGCAKRFADAGFIVTIADINREAGEVALSDILRRTQSSNCRYEFVDLADANSVTALAVRLAERGETIDVLVNNAGIYPPAKRALSAEDHELTFAIAHLGHFRLTHALWPLLVRAPAARVISVSSLVQRNARIDLANLALQQGYAPIRAYQQAKLACLLFALELQRRLDAVGSTVTSYAAHPGVCRTQLAKNRRRGEQDSLWQRFASASMRWGMSHIGLSPETGADPVIEAATSSNYAPGSFLGPTGFLETAGKTGVVKPGAAASDIGLAATLWQRSELLTGVQWKF